MNGYGEFYDLEVWKEARELRKAVSVLTRKFPPEEIYRLTDQIKRSSRSVTANIAEAHGRFHKKELIQFQRHSRGSLKETLDHLFCALDEECITQEIFNEMKGRYEKCLKLLNGYIKYLNDRSA
ncbi:MAG TPA: four helix bundle protein [Bacteroidia bacterium]|nr:four helix bundle protein [Bacteroidia bacterium]